MKAEIAEAWVAALRSGQYRQGTGRLRRENDTFCCLGVLCQLAADANVIPAPVLIETASEPSYRYGDPNLSELGTSRGVGYLPVEVLEWAGIDSDNGAFTNRTGVYTALTTLNDAGKTFDQIAQVIEEEADKL